MRVIQLEDAIALKTDGPSDYIANVDLDALRRQGVGDEMLAIVQSYIGRTRRSGS